MNQCHKLGDVQDISISTRQCMLSEWVRFQWSALFFLEEKTAFWAVIVGNGVVLCCLRSTGLFLILTGLALLKQPPSVSSLPRADPLHLVQSWRPLPPWNKHSHIHALFMTLLPVRTAVNNIGRLTGSSERQRESNTIWLSIPHTHFTLSHVTSTALKCIGFMSSLTCA